MENWIYLDYNASTPVAHRVVEVMSKYLMQHFGNPSSLHWAGREAKKAVDKARLQVTKLLHCEHSEIVFTSGGTEANNLALKGLFFANDRKHPQFHIITSQIEHPAISQPCAFLESLGAEVTRLPVDQWGQVCPDDVRRAMRSSTALVTIMHANNEVGTIQRLTDITKVAHEHGVPVHTDAAQSCGKIEVDVRSLGVDMLSMAGHKLYAPKGVGVLFVRAGLSLEPILHGAGHEMGRRAGTENILEIVGLGEACELATEWVNRRSLIDMRNYFWQALHAELGHQVVLNGHPDLRLPNTMHVSFPGHIGNEILARIPLLAASTGSACHAGQMHVSPVLKAMGMHEREGLGSIRFSLGRESTKAEIDFVVEQLRRVVATASKNLA